jgi:hypothetical protein
VKFSLPSDTRDVLETALNLRHSARPPADQIQVGPMSADSVSQDTNISHRPYPAEGSGDTTSGIISGLNKTAGAVNAVGSAKEDDRLSAALPVNDEVAVIGSPAEGTGAINPVKQEVQLMDGSVVNAPTTSYTQEQLKVIFELDIVDYGNIPTLIAQVRKRLNTIEFLERLNVIAHTGEDMSSSRSASTQQIHQLKA